MHDTSKTAKQRQRSISIIMAEWILAIEICILREKQGKNQDGTESKTAEL
jgi:hypothetical protein